MRSTFAFRTARDPSGFAIAPRFRALLSAALLLGASVPAAPVHAGAAGDLRCEIRSRDLGARRELTGVVWADRTGAVGDYRFEVSSQGAGGRSNVRQGGRVRVDPAGAQIVGTVIVSAAQGARHLARLVVQTDAGTCLAES